MLQAAANSVQLEIEIAVQTKRERNALYQDSYYRPSYASGNTFLHLFRLQTVSRSNMTLRSVLNCLSPSLM